MTDDIVRKDAKNLVKDAPAKAVAQPDSVKTELYLECVRAALAIGKDLLEIARIREQGNQDVARLEALTRHVEATMRDERERLRELTAGAQQRKDAVMPIVASLIQAIQAIPETDTASRLEAIRVIRELGLAVIHGTP